MLRTILRNALLPVALLASPLLAEGGPLIEKTVDVPRDMKVAVDISYDKVVIPWVETQGEPKESEIRDAERKGGKETTYMLIRFTYDNEGYVKRKVKLSGILLGEDGTVMGEGGRTGTLGAKQIADTVSFPMKVKVTDWPKARKLKLTVAFLE